MKASKKAKSAKTATPAAIAKAKSLGVWRRRLAKATYDDACAYAAAMRAAGMTISAMVDVLRHDDWPTAKGGNWWNNNASLAADKGSPKKPPQPPRGGGKARAKPDAKNASQATPAPVATMPTTPAKKQEKAAALAVLNYFDGKGAGAGEASEQASKRFADAMATAEPTEQRRGLKRMTRAGWESLPEPVREAVIERIYKDVVGQ